jgi:hypothetical protein
MGKIKYRRHPKKEENKNDLVCGQYVGCKMKCGQDLKPIKVDVSKKNYNF